MRRILLISAIIPLQLSSQTEPVDTITYGMESSVHPKVEQLTTQDSIDRQEYPASFAPYFNPTLDPSFVFRPVRPVVIDTQIRPPISGEASIFYWNSGEMTASGGIRQFPGMMQIECASIGIRQDTGNFSFYIGGTANKYGYYGGVHTQYGIDGNVTYRLTAGISLTAFGNYYFGQPPVMANGMPMPPSMIGYFARSTFGGYLDYRINDHWGIQTGAQTVRQIGTNRYEAEPIVTPYYKINKKIAIGLPVGQILYHILK